MLVEHSKNRYLRILLVFYKHPSLFISLQTIETCGLLRQGVNIKALVKRYMLVDDSWFSPNYHQLSSTWSNAQRCSWQLTVVHRQSRKQSHESIELLPSSFRVKMWTLNGVRETNLLKYEFFATKEGGSLLRATKGARNPNLNVAFTNACAAVV